MGEFDNENVLRASLRELIATGPTVVRVVHDIYNGLTRAALSKSEQTEMISVMRWRAVYLMGQLGHRDGVRPLYEIARKELPDPSAGEQAFLDEYRLRVRAIVGLQQLKAKAELDDLYARGGPLTNSVVTSLFELGVELPNTRRIPVDAALAEDKADWADYNKNAGRPPQPLKPSGEKYDVKSRSDTPETKR